MNIVEFALKFKDLASQPLRQFGTAAGQSFSRAKTMSDNLTSHNRVLGQSYNELQAQIKKVENTIRTSTIPSQIAAARRELESLQRQANNHQGRIGGGYSLGGASGSSSGGGGGLAGLLSSFGGLKGMIATLGIGFMLNSAISTTGSFISDSINKGLERQQIQTSFNVLAGSEQAGGALTKQLVGLQKDTILGSEVFKNAQTMMGFGFKSEEVYDNLKMLGDVSMGDAQKLGSLTLAFSQIRAGGKLTGQDLLQLINAGFNPLETMAAKTGKSVAVLKDEMSKGLVTFGMVQQAFKDATSQGGRFENMLGKIAETPAGKVQQLTGAWQEFKVQAGAAMMPLVSMALDLGQKVLPIVESLIKPLTSGVKQIADWINRVSSETQGWQSYLNSIKYLFQNSIIPFMSKMWGLITHVTSKMVEFVGQSELLKDVFKFAVVQLSLTIKLLEHFINQIKFVFDVVIMPQLKMLESIYRLITGKSTGVKLDSTLTTKLSSSDKKDQQTTLQLLNDIAGNTSANAEAAKNNESTITGGGQRVTNIHVAKFLDSINLTTMNMQEGASEIERIFLELFSRVTVSGAH